MALPSKLPTRPVPPVKRIVFITRKRLFFFNELIHLFFLSSLGTVAAATPNAVVVVAEIVLNNAQENQQPAPNGQFYQPPRDVNVSG